MTGTTGWPKATASESSLRLPINAALPKAHKLLHGTERLIISYQCPMKLMGKAYRI